MAELAGGEHPLIELADGGPFPHPPPLGEARAFKTTRLLATSDGRAVLAGTADRVELLGIDRWLGGTHVTPENLWRRDSTTGAVIGSDPVG